MPVKTLKDVGKAFQSARRLLLWTQEELAHQSIVGLSTLKKVERGQRVRQYTHRVVLAKINEQLSSLNPAQPPVVIPYPWPDGDETELLPSPPVPSAGRPMARPIDNPHLLAMHEALRHTAPPCARRKFRLGDIRSPAELKNLWAIDNTAYQDANITFEHFLDLWQAFPLGLRVLFFENEIMGAIGIWPVSCRWAEQLKAASLKEAQLDSRMVRQCGRQSAQCWYVTGVVLREQLIGGRGSKQLLQEGLGSWLARAKIRYPCEIMALAYSDHGKRLLERFKFFCVQDETAMPDKCALYALLLESRAEFIKLMRERRLDVS